MGAAVFAVVLVGNALNLAYNVPYVYLIVTLWEAKNISWYYVLMRMAGAVIFMIYAAMISDLWLGISFAVTFVSSALVAPVKLCRRPSFLPPPQEAPQLHATVV